MLSTVRSTLFSALFLSLGAAALPAQMTPESILARYVSVTDPQGRSASIQGLRAVSTLELPAAGMTATITILQARPNLFLSTTEMAAVGKMLQGYDGTTVWAVDPMQGPRILTGREAAAVTDAAAAFATTRHADLYSSMVLAGEADVDGDKATCVTFTWKSGRVMTDCFSDATGLIVESRIKEQSPQGEIEIVSRPSDYRLVGGLLLPHKATANVMGMAATTTTTSVEFGPLDTMLFALPPEIRALRAP